MNAAPPIEQLVYAHADLPRLLEQQLWDFARLVWGDDLMGDGRFRSRSWDDPPPTHFVRVAGDLLVSHVQVLPFRFDSAPGLRVGGVGAVLTYPQFRGEGHASALMRGAAEHIRETADVGLLFCDARTAPLYERLGWTALPRGRLRVRGEIRDTVAMALGDDAAIPDPFDVDHGW